jgi:histidine triad (HIT) family protein
MSFQLPVMDPCYFCAIIEGEAEQWNIIAQNELTVTMLNGRQFEVGQCVILPLRHAPTLLDLTEQELAAVMTAAKKLTQVMVKAFAPEGVLLYQNNGVGSGQEVPHFHLHIVPRRSASDWGLGPPHIARLEQQKSPIQFDHAAITISKRQTVELLRNHY